MGEKSYGIAALKIKKIMSSPTSDCWSEEFSVEGVNKKPLFFDDHVFYGALLGFAEVGTGQNLQLVLKSVSSFGRRLLRITSDFGMHRLVVVIVSVQNDDYLRVGDGLFEEKRTNGAFAVRLLPRDDFEPLESRVESELSILELLSSRPVFKLRDIDVTPYVTERIMKAVSPEIIAQAEEDLAEMNMNSIKGFRFDHMMRDISGEN